MDITGAPDEKVVDIREELDLPKLAPGGPMTTWGPGADITGPLETVVPGADVVAGGDQEEDQLAESSSLMTLVNLRDLPS